MLAAIALAASVQVSDVQIAASPEEVAKCERLGEVSGGTALGGLWAKSAPDRAMKKLKQDAAKLGGTHVLIVTSSAGHAGASAMGIAYRCPAP